MDDEQELSAAEQERLERLAEERAWARRDRRIAALVALVFLVAIVGGIWHMWAKRQPPQAPVPQIAASSPGPAPAAGIASPDAPACHAAISVNGGEPGAGVLAQVGDVIRVETDCPGNMVDLLMVEPDGEGVLGSVQLDRDGDVWALEMPIGEQTQGRSFAVWVWVDGYPVAALGLVVGA